MLRKRLMVVVFLLLAACNVSGSRAEGSLSSGTGQTGSASSLASQLEAAVRLPSTGDTAVNPASPPIVKAAKLISNEALPVSNNSQDVSVNPQELSPAQVSAALQDGPQPELETNRVAPGVNPLTGLPVDDPALLSLRPALISVTNFPASARPQAGLSFSPYVFEIYIGEGMTRFLALFYGEYPAPDQGSPATETDYTIGPIRSGRLPYESLRRLYNGFLVMASADASVGAALGDSSNILGSDADNINSALIDVTRLRSIAKANTKARGPFELSGLNYSTEAPAGGSAADRLWVFYSWLNQVLWTYDSDSGSYLRAQDNADGSGKFTPGTDRLNGEPLAFENVVVMFANHRVLNRQGTLIDIDLLYTRNSGFLLRDKQVFPIYWTTIGGEYEKQTGLMRPIRFTDRQGNPIALKPGQTWIEVVDVTTAWQELEPGYYKARFYAPSR